MMNSLIRRLLKKHLNESQKRIVKYCLSKILYRNDLSKLASIFNSDKGVQHHYTKHYQQHFYPLHRKKMNILEIGIGGYGNPKAGGQSLRMWKVFFPNSQIYGIDIENKKYHEERRIKTFKGSQIDEEFLRNVAAEIGTVDIIIDDGSHINDHVIKTFQILFPLMNSNGIYIVEDLQTSYWTDIDGGNWGGSSDLAAPHTSMNFFKKLVDGLNYEEFPADDYKPSYIDKHIIAIHFYHNMVFIYKGLNNEGSNLLGKRFSQDLFKSSQ